MAIKVWNEITYTFLNFNGSTIEVWRWLIFHGGLQYQQPFKLYAIFKKDLVPSFLHFCQVVLCISVVVVCDRSILRHVRLDVA